MKEQPYKVLQTKYNNENPRIKAVENHNLKSKFPETVSTVHHFSSNIINQLINFLPHLFRS